MKKPKWLRCFILMAMRRIRLEVLLSVEPPEKSE
jgi:hypothetical protein